MTPEAQKWRDHFARCEEEQLLLFPPRQPQTPLARAQAEVARSFLRTRFPLEKWTGQRDSLDALRADEPTRFAFFEHFGFPRLRGIFCFTNYEWEVVVKRFNEKENGMWAFSRHWHEFLPCAQTSDKRIRMAFNKALPEELDSKTLFIRNYGDAFGPLAAEGREELWHWNDENFVQLPEYGSLWVS